MNIQTIMKRKSIRSYRDAPVQGAERKKLMAFMDKCGKEEGIFGNRVRLQYVENNKSGDVKLGTYGVIKGARTFMTAVCKKTDYNLEDIGYQFEKLVLYATQMGLATVWLGGTFERGRFAKAVKLKADEVMPVVSPIGYEGHKQSLLGRMIKSNAGNRKSWNELFFDGVWQTPVASEDEFAEVLEAVRQAPSTMNAQPWRILKEEGGYFHFYREGKMELNRIDMGIALCHFEIAAAEKGFQGSFHVLQKENHGNAKYLVSWVRE